MATTAKKYDIDHISGPEGQLRGGEWLRPLLGDASTDQIQQRSGLLASFTTMDERDTDAQKQLKIGMETAREFLAQCHNNLKDTVDAFLVDARAFFKTLSVGASDAYGVVTGFFAGLLFCAHQGLMVLDNLMEKCLYEALAVTKKVLQWLQNEELQNGNVCHQNSLKTAIRG